MRQQINVLALVLALALTVLLSAQLPTRAQTAKKHKPGDGSIGTTQMAGGNGKFGVTYTLTDHNGLVINYTILSAAYKIEPALVDKNNPSAPNSTQKVVEIHYKVKNPNPTDMYYNAYDYLQLIDPLDQTITTTSGTGRNLMTDAGADGTLKPGQGIDDIVTYAIVPGKGPVSKLIVTLPRLGVNEKVLRFPLGTAPNIVKPLPAPYADPADTTGATALTEIPATFGTSYTAGFCSVSVSAPVMVDGSLGTNAPDAGKKFCTFEVKETNLTKRQLYLDGTGNLNAVLTDTDGDSIHQLGNAFKPQHDEGFEGRQYDPGETALLRIAFMIPSDANLQKLKVTTAEDNTGDVSETLSYDVSAAK